MPSGPVENFLVRAGQGARKRFRRRSAVRALSRGVLSRGHQHHARGIPTATDLVKILADFIYRLVDPATLKETMTELLPNFLLPANLRHPIRHQLFEFSAALAGKDFFSDAETYFESAETFSVGADFDHVVCAIPAPVTARILTGIAGNAELSGIADVQTVSTIQAQTWLDRKIEDLGWKFGGVALGGFLQPLDTMLERSSSAPDQPRASEPAFCR